MTDTAGDTAACFPQGGRRLVVFVLYDPRGDVQDYVVHALRGLRPHASEILVVVNGRLSDAGRTRLKSIADRIQVRANAGFDIGGFRDALLDLGPTARGFDEILLTNDTWFGPLRTFDDVFRRMDRRPLDLWGLTEHPETEAGTDLRPRHLQSFWIAARRRLLDSPVWTDYWREQPLFESYWEAVSGHEIPFTAFMESRGFTTGAAFPAGRYPVDNASVYAADLLIADGCPVVKRRPFFHDPIFLHRHAVIGRWVMSAMREAGYPTELAWSALARTVSPRVLLADTGGVEVLVGSALAIAPVDPRLVVVVAAADPPTARRFLEAADVVTDGAPAIVHAPPGMREEMLRALGESSARSVRDAQVIVSTVPTEVAAAVSQEVRDGGYDFVLAAAPAERRADSPPEEIYASRYGEENLVDSRLHFLRILAMFVAQPALGLAFPPLRHIAASADLRDAHDTTALDAACAAAEIRVPRDRIAPVAPADGVWLARTAALSRLDGADLGGLDALSARRLLVLAAAEEGYVPRTVMTVEHAAVAHTSLEFATDVVASSTRGWPTDQVAFLEQAGWHGQTDLPSLLALYLRRHRPRVAATIRRVVRRPTRGGA